MIGEHRITAAEYHADPCPEPSLSSSMIKIMCSRSMAHAAAAHPKISKPESTGDAEAKYDFGSSVHDLILEGGSKVAVIDPRDYLSKTGEVPKGWTNTAIRAARDEARARGMIPMLLDDYTAAANTAEAIECMMGSNQDVSAMLGDMVTEHTIIWQEENGVWCRARFDMWSPSTGLIGDLKTSARCLAPHDAWRYAASLDWAIQAEWYKRGARKLGLHNAPEMLFISAEVEPPYATAVYRMSGLDAELAQKKIEWAIDRWGECIRRGEWPGYPKATMTIEGPMWQHTDWEARASDDTVISNGEIR